MIRFAAASLSLVGLLALASLRAELALGGVAFTLPVSSR